MVDNRLYGLIFLFVLWFSPGVAQKNFAFRGIERMGVGINSEAEEIMPILSEDGSILYFSRAFSKENAGGDAAGSDIWYSSQVGNWESSYRAPNSVNNRDNNAVVGLNANGNVIYLLNGYSRAEGISYMDGSPENWSKPTVISVEGIDSEGFIGVYVSPDYSVMLLSMKKSGGRGQEDLYVSLRDSLTGNWGRPLPLGPTINTRGFEISPYLSRDKRYLFFASDGHGGLGDADIYVSERLYDRWDVWSNPVNLGSGINSDKFDAYFSIAKDSTIFFSTNRDGGLSDIYRGKLYVNTNSRQPEDARKIIAEAEALLNDLRQTNVKDEQLIVFEDGSSELNDAARSALRGLIERLQYQDYSSFHLLTVDPDRTVNRELKDARVDAIKRFISVLGIGGKNIYDYPATQSVTMKGGEVFNSAEGILIIVKD
ncbi:hypothetical protein [Fulvivirga sedimenti]|uniref:OmpA-like domain-containing protein n=1 Tax=Fulvivirga sedimenti TaxID=2879465 RepID=A0A9X1HYH4_9BACT|nr:hypothetical protein [Fulvivirga sedimenti]MCA6078764.1 hypothetical protein [Fulvivirga sedimenti]